MNVPYHRSRVVAAVALGCALAAPRPAPAGIIRVPVDQRRIDQALAVAAPGDTIRVVGNGGATYPDRLIISQDVTIEGGWRADFQVHDPSIYVTVVRDTTLLYQRSVIRIDGAPRVVLEGLTVIGGRLGVEAADGPDLVLRDCGFRDQTNNHRGFGDEPGAAVYQRGGTFLAEGVTTRNTLSAFAGAALALIDVAPAVVRDCALTRATSRPFNPPDVFDPAPGGGILLSGSAVTMERVTLSQCAAQLDAGGGLYATGSTLDFRDCQFRQCVSPRKEGGAMLLVDCPSVTVDGCVIEQNSSVAGGGINAQRVGSLTITGTRISHNLVNSEGGALWIDSSNLTLRQDTLDTNNPGSVAATRGGGVWCRSTSGLVEDTIIQGEGTIGAGGAWFQLGGDVVFRRAQLRDNTSGFYGGAAHIELGGRIRMENCLVESNSAKFGGGCSASFTARLEVDHCTFTGNSVLNAGASFYLDTAAVGAISNSIACCSPAAAQLVCSSATAQVTSCDFWNDDTVNALPEYAGSCPDVTGASGNIRLDPLFCTGDPTFLLSGASPCLGAASDGGDIGWAGSGCARPLSLTRESWGRIKARYGSRD